MGHSDHSFTLQAVMELQKSVGEMNANLTGVKSSVDSVKSKVDDLVAWKNRILGIALGVGAMISILSILLTKSYLTIGAPPIVVPAASVGAAPVPVPTAAPTSPAQPSSRSNVAASAVSP